IARGNVDDELHIKIARPLALARNAFAAQASHLPALGALRHLETDLTVRRWDLDLLPSVGFADRDRDIQVQIVALPLEERVRRNVDGEQQVTGRAAAHARRAMLRDPDAAALVRAGGDPHAH